MHLIRRTEKDVFRKATCPHCGKIAHYRGKTEIIVFVSAATAQPLSKPSPLLQTLQLECPYCSKMFKEQIWVERGVILTNVAVTR